MKLKRLIRDIQNIEIKGSKEVEITGVCSHSKQIAPGNLFIAKRGRLHDGSHYIHEAITTGAIAILSDMFDPSLKVTQIIHPNVGELEAVFASRFHQRPSQELLMMGVTGTNGKTTVSYFLKHLFDSAGMKCGLIGTIEYLIGEHAVKATHTTPDVTANHKMLREMVNHSCQSAVMEVTSHALHQGRVNEVQFDVAIFTNLTAEHLDYHQTMEEYCKQKCRLFSSIDPDLKKKIPYPKLAIVNVDDRWSKEIIKSCRIPVLTYGITNEADLRAVDINLKEDGIEYVLDYLGSSYPVFIPLIGRFNVYNSLASIACAVSQNIPVEKALDAASRFPAVPGRLQPVPNQKGVKIFVDFAHTPDALDHVLKCLQETAKGKMITVFGCGGDRDPYKRPEMGKISEKYSDLTILTSDNPRSEDPSKIIREIAKGFQDKGRYAIEEDRQEAIRKAIEKAKKGDIVLIAGKGHETSQTFAHHTIEFNDWKVAREYSSI